VIQEKAIELGRLIGQSDEYKALRSANELVREQEELRTKMDALTNLAQSIDEVAGQGSEPSPEQVEQYNALLSEIQADAKYQGVVAAQSNFDKLMLRVNELILDGMRKGAASPIITLG
jgi:cell fate (sporulation/competence/biofilm development) regulator YlbF (YheA/YmcA/DUF963 family)